jgi:outer membrane protein
MFTRIAKTVFTLILFVAAVMTAGYAQQAQTAQPAQPAGKIGVINSQEILEKSVEGKRVITQLQARDKQYQADLTKRDEEIRQLETRLNTQQLTLTQDALLQLNTDLEKKRTDRKRIQEDAAADMQNMQVRLFSKVQTELIAIVEALGKERGFDMIIDLGKSGAIYWSPGIELTAEVIKKYDATKVTPPGK